MIPVRLQLKNFMSYGEAPPLLDFEQFSVACLSGRNGQGKSALLDAITWALWGQARKSSGARKPDDDLIRIGTTHMEVELVFDLEGERYRVTRGYGRSASGKTSKPSLEVQIREPQSADFRPLTGVNLGETQQVLDRILGIDYATFINASFLLQGRSDEFTKKSPRDRKAILSTVLALDRYAQMEALARDRERGARQDREQALQDIERLEKALEPVPLWEAELAAVQASIDAQNVALQALREAEEDLARQLERLTLKAQEASRLEQRLQALRSQATEAQQAIEAAQTKVQEADALLAQADEIQRHFERYNALQAERDQLDEQRTLVEGLQVQRRRLEEEMRTLRHQHESRLRQLTQHMERDRRDLTQLIAHLQEAGSVRAQHQQAREAQASLATLEEARRQREHHQKRIEEASRSIELERQRLHTEREAAQRQAADVTASLEAQQQKLGALPALRTDSEALPALQADQRALEEEGTALKETLQQRRGECEALQVQVTQLEQRQAKLLSLETETCPTCGTDLTPAHRATVQEQLDHELQGLRQRLKQGRDWIEGQSDTLLTLRNRFKSIRSALERASEADKQRVALEAVAEQVEALQAQRQRLQEQVVRLGVQLEGETFGAEPRAARQAAQEAFEAVPFDAHRYEATRQAAVRLTDLTRRLGELEEMAGRRTQLEQSIQADQKKEQSLRAELDRGSVYGTLPERIQRFQKQEVDIGYDGQRLEDVKARLKTLQDSPVRMQKLAHAQQYKAEYEAQRDQAQQRWEQVKAEGVTCREQLDSLGRVAEEQGRLAAEKAAKEQQRAEARTALDAEQVRKGRLASSLEQARLHQRERRERRTVLKKAQHLETVYQRLRKAFGRDGIPSLIIEQSIPDIEERANQILDRLADGRMRIRLQTTREKKSGGDKETLDIIITDEQGVARAYETFSGGEAFRVNFALRIALAQLLAERSGVRIRTLVIDEGFGTQDEQGVQSMVEVTQAIQDDFDKILIITHLDQLKEAFPVRIEVEKDPIVGSRFEVIGV
ncbi:MAG: SMC family ATPase [Bacteroidota bacterium]